MLYNSFSEYNRESEPGKYDKSRAWQTAIGLQAVDGLRPSDYLRHCAQRNIEGDLGFAEVEALLQSYYAEKPRLDTSERSEEADLVSVRIAGLLSEQGFHFGVVDYIAIHKRLFAGIYAHAGTLRDDNISKKEWVLDGDTVTYGTASQLLATLEYDLAEERKFSYKGLSMERVIRHLAGFVARLWQIHPFAEGNTRTTAVFFIKYLQTLGFSVTNDSFARHA